MWLELKRLLIGLVAVGSFAAVIGLILSLLHYMQTRPYLVAGVLSTILILCVSYLIGLWITTRDNRNLPV